MWMCEGVFRSTTKIESRKKVWATRFASTSYPCLFLPSHSDGRSVGRLVVLCLFVFYLILSSSSHKNTQRLLFKERIECILRDRSSQRMLCMLISHKLDNHFSRTLIRSHVEYSLVELTQHIINKPAKKNTARRIEQTKNVNKQMWN